MKCGICDILGKNIEKIIMYKSVISYYSKTIKDKFKVKYGKDTEELIITTETNVDIASAKRIENLEDTGILSGTEELEDFIITIYNQYKDCIRNGLIEEVKKKGNQ